VSKHYHFIALSQRYFGNEPWADNGARFLVTTHAEDLVEFIRKTTGGPVNVVGWSYSGSVILTAAVQHPELISSLFLFEPSVPSIVDNPADKKSISEDRAEIVRDALAAVKSGNNASAVRLFMDGVNGMEGSFRALPDDVRSAMLENAKMLPLLLMAPTPPPLMCSQLKQLKFPVAIVRGEFTRTFYKVIADSATACIPQSQSIVVPNSRHLYPVQEPQAFTEILLKFLKSVP
jgi:pimeloyl-ACP methyl ester carboxylesterase